MAEEEGEQKDEKKASESESSKKKTKKRNKEQFIFGNYKGYYGYRVDSKSKADPRLSVMRREWFEGKDCLDIGCNQGIITIEIAKRFQCRRILGIDIDDDLVEMAQTNLKRMASQLNRCSKSSKCKGPEVPKDGDGEVLQEADSTYTSKYSTKYLLNTVRFSIENFVVDTYHDGEMYDTILCLSVTKWIHLNWGDSGIVTLFSKIWKLLRPGGILILEPQPWVSYQRKRRVSEVASSTFGAIELFPDLFPDILLDKIGFRSMENITETVPGSVAGFERPIFVYYK